jgi:hypothetical protein
VLVVVVGTVDVVDGGPVEVVLEAAAVVNVVVTAKPPSSSDPNPPATANATPPRMRPIAARPSTSPALPARVGVSL